MKKPLLIARLAWFMLFGAVFVYGVIAFLLIQEEGGAVSMVHMKPLRMAVTFSAMFAVGLSFFRPLWTKTLPRLGRNPQGESPFDEKLLVLTIIHCALAETASIYGLVLAVVSHQMTDFYPLAGVSIVALLAHYPRAAAWEEWKERAAGPR